MAFYRFLFAPVLLAVAVLTSSPRRAREPHHAPAPAATAPSISAPAASPAREARVAPSRPGSVR